MVAMGNLMPVIVTRKTTQGCHSLKYLLTLESSDTLTKDAAQRSLDLIHQVCVGGKKKGFTLCEIINMIQGCIFSYRQYLRILSNAVTLLKVLLVGNRVTWRRRRRRPTGSLTSL